MTTSPTDQLTDQLPLPAPPAPDHAAAQGREPVQDAARLAGLLNALLVALGGIPATIVAGLNTPEGWQALATATGAVLTAAIALAAFLVSVRTAATARAQVTPLLDPRDLSGRQLVPAQPDPDALALQHTVAALIDEVRELLGQAGGDHSAVTVHLTGRTTNVDGAARTLQQLAHRLPR